MSVALLDVNVLVAIFDPAHENHEDAHRWFGRNRKYGWATCPVTINGCIRVLSNPAYPTVETTPAEVAGRLRRNVPPQTLAEADQYMLQGEAFSRAVPLVSSDAA